MSKIPRMNISEELFFADNWKRIMCKRGRGPVCRICFLFEKALVEKRRRVRNHCILRRFCISCILSVGILLWDCCREEPGKFEQSENFIGILFW